jgi:hypothetical protein
MRDETEVTKGFQDKSCIRYSVIGMEWFNGLTVRRFDGSFFRLRSFIFCRFLQIINGKKQLAVGSWQWFDGSKV